MQLRDYYKNQELHNCSIFTCVRKPLNRLVSAYFSPNLYSRKDPNTNKYVFPKTVEFDIDKFKLIISQKPFLGICIGLQVLMTTSEEDNTMCLNVFDGSVKKISNTKKGDIKLPHMGWSPVQIKEQHPIFKDINNNSFFYFVHSFYVDPRNDKEKTSYTDYGLHFTSTINRDNYVAVQFHPEKSSTNGLILLKNFIDWSV